MSEAFVQIQVFVDEVIKQDSTFMFSKNGDYLVLKSGSKDVIPFWSSSGKAQMIQVFFPEYDDYKIVGMSLKEFYDWLPEAEQQNLCIGLNWSGKSLEGYDIAPADLHGLLAKYLKKKPASRGK